MSRSAIAAPSASTGKRVLQPLDQRDERLTVSTDRRLLDLSRAHPDNTSAPVNPIDYQP